MSEHVVINGARFDYVGHIDVDADLVAIGDPCYTTGRDASSAVESWTDYLDLLNEVGMFRSAEEKSTGQPYKHKGASVVMRTFYGDGSYPVYVNFDVSYLGGIRPRGVFIDFDPGNDEDEDDDNAFGDLDDGMGIYEVYDE